MSQTAAEARKMLIDTHCHVHDLEHFPDVGAEVARALEAGVGRIVVVGVEPEDWDRALEVADAHADVWAVLGWHPNHTADYDQARLDGLAERLRHPKVVALGEIGLDFHWDFAARDRQAAALNDQLELAEAVGLPVVFHAREAYDELLEVLEARPVRPYLMHCFAGNAEHARRATALGATFGVDGPITYKKADELRAVVAGIPRDRIVLETDSPYMSPVPHRGKPNRPAYVREVAVGVAALWGVGIDEVAEITTANARRFFGWSD